MAGDEEEEEEEDPRRRKRRDRRREIPRPLGLLEPGLVARLDAEEAELRPRWIYLGNLVDLPRGIRRLRRFFPPFLVPSGLQRASRLRSGFLSFSKGPFEAPALHPFLPPSPIGVGGGSSSECYKFGGGGVLDLGPQKRT